MAVKKSRQYEVDGAKYAFDFVSDKLAGIKKVVSDVLTPVDPTTAEFAKISSSDEAFSISLVSLFTVLVSDDIRNRIVPLPLREQPDIWVQITIPNEFQPVGKYNIGGLDAEEIFQQDISKDARRDREKAVGDIEDKVQKARDEKDEYEKRQEIKQRKAEITEQLNEIYKSRTKTRKHKIRTNTNEKSPKISKAISMRMWQGVCP